jgi:LPPG:FO 2-phospho-L-lactate transferase
VRAIRYVGADRATPLPELVDLLGSSTLECIVLCPSNPYLSVGPILGIPELRRALERCGAPTVVVSPIIAGRAVKGPTAKLMQELGHEITPRSIAEHYAGLADGLIVDQADAAYAADVGLPTLGMPTLMQTLEDRKRLARDALEFARSLDARRPARRGSA